MRVLTEIVRDIVVILLLTTLLQMLLPSYNLRRFLKVAMGLFVLITLLNPLMQLVNTARNESIAAFAFSQPKELKGQETGLMLFEENFQQRTEQQIASLIKLVNAVPEVEVEVRLKQSGSKVKRESIAEVIVTIEKEKLPAERGIAALKALPQPEPGPEGSMMPSGTTGQERRASSSGATWQKGAALPGATRQEGAALPGATRQEATAEAERAMEQELVATVCRYFGLKASQVNVQFR
jgi:stage III sporulation protein AF